MEKEGQLTGEGEKEEEIEMGHKQGTAEVLVFLHVRNGYTSISIL